MIERHAEAGIQELLAHMRVVVVLGARQVGKTTVVERIAGMDDDARTVTLDDEVARLAAIDDPVGFVAGLGRFTVIDEVQRAPDLMLAIKSRVDHDRNPGQFLLTGSSNLLTSGVVPDTLPGRAAYVRLMPLSRAEIAGVTSGVVEALFDGRMPEGGSTQNVGITPLLDEVVAGGYPEVFAMSQSVRDRYFAAYVRSILGRNVDELARVQNHDALTRVLRLVAARSAGQLNVTAIGAEAGLDDKTCRRYVGILEDLFLVQTLPAWSRSIVKRQVKMPKVVIPDTGLLAHLLRIDADRLRADAGGRSVGTFFETFAINEIAKLCSVERETIELFHYRDRDRREIDLILERNDGSAVAIEFKASATVRPVDFRHLDFLAEKVGDQLKCSVVFYTGAEPVQFAPRKFAVPVGALWA